MGISRSNSLCFSRQNISCSQWSYFETKITTRRFLLVKFIFQEALIYFAKGEYAIATSDSGIEKFFISQATRAKK